MRNVLLSAQICTICQKPKQSEETGSFTQWFAVCKCQNVEDTGQSVVLCAKCGRTVDQIETGSFTQWVLKKNSCQCDNPVYLPVSPTQMTIAAGNPISPEVVQAADSFDVGSLKQETFPLHRYKPIKRLGFGGAGTVFLCHDDHLKKDVAVKVLRQTTDENAVNFQKEAKVMAKLEHPNLTNILDLGITEGGAPYMVMEYMDGTSLEQVLSKTGTLEETTARDLFIQIADALEHVHIAGIFHRDIKTSNVLIIQQENGALKASVIDFGIAFLYSGEQGTTAQGLTVVGTPRYMPPDQIRGTKFDARSEVYSLGCLMYKVLTGRLPFDSEDTLSLLDKHANAKVPSFREVNPELRIDSEFERLVMKCLEKEPEDRFQSMEKLSRALKSLELTRLNPMTRPRTISIEGSMVSGKLLVIFSLLLVTIAAVAIMALYHDDSKKDVAPETVRKPYEYTLPKKVSNDQTNDFDELNKQFSKAGGVDLGQEKKIALKPDNKNNALSLDGSGVKDEDLKRIDPSVERVYLSSTATTNKGLEALSNLKNISHLELNRIKIDHNGISHLKKLPKLISITLNNNNLSDQSIHELSEIKTLETISLNQNKKITGPAIEELARLPKLNLLSLSRTNIPTGSIAKLKNLSTLRIAFNELKDSDLLPLKAMPKLIDLTVSGNDFTESGIRTICTFPKLERLEFNDFKFKKTAYLLFNHSSTIKNLHLRRNKISDYDVQILLNFTQLKMLDLCDNPITQKGILEIARKKPDVTFIYDDGGLGSSDQLGVTLTGMLNLEMRPKNKITSDLMLDY